MVGRATQPALLSHTLRHHSRPRIVFGDAQIGRGNSTGILRPHTHSGKSPGSRNGGYGVISYLVPQRRSEIGIRLAVGAGRAQILKMVFRESAFLLVVTFLATLIPARRAAGIDPMTALRDE